MKECCATCKLRYDLMVSDYSHGGCIDKDVDNGFICMAFSGERKAVFMIGINKEGGHCECWTDENRMDYDLVLCQDLAQTKVR